MVSVEDTTLVQESSGTWAVARSGRLVERFDDARSAVFKFEDIVGPSPGRVVWHSDQDEILDVLVDSGSDTFLIDHPDGLVCVDGWWIPADIHPEYGGNYEKLKSVAEVGFGKSSDTWYEWNDVYLVIRWEAEEGSTLSVEESLPGDDELEAGFQQPSNAFEHYIGLDNLNISERPTEIDLDDLNHEFFLTSYWRHGGYEIAELRIATNSDQTAWHVIDISHLRIVGTFSTLNDLVSAVIEEPELTLFVDLEGPHRNRKWVPSEERLVKLLAELRN